MSPKSTLYIMCGLPFSGKTYTSKLISKQLHCQRVSYDELWAEEKATTSKSVPYDILMPEAQAMLTTMLRNGQSVVFDTLNDTVDNRDMLRNLASKAGAHSVVIYLNVPQDVLLQRRAQNEQTNTRHSVTDNKLTEAFTRLEPPTNEVDVIEFQAGDNLDEWAKRLHQNPKA